MAAGDWKVGSRIVINDIQTGYNDDGTAQAPPTLSNVTIVWKARLPGSGLLVGPFTDVTQCPAGSTSANVVAQVQSAFTGITTREGISP